MHMTAALDRGRPANVNDIEVKFLAQPMTIKEYVGNYRVNEPWWPAYRSAI